MARRRKVSNMLALAVLSVVSNKPMHPYEMASVLRSRGKEQDMEIKWGSLYTVVQNLEKHGLVEVADTEQQGGRPARTVYRITEAGRTELTDWVRELVAEPGREVPRFKAGLSEMGVLPPDEAIPLLRRRLETMEAQLAEAGEALERHVGQIPRMFLVEDEYELAIGRAEVVWLRSILRELTEGTLPGMEMWRAYHETGEIPPDIAEIAERGTTD